MKLHERIKQRREELGISQEELARRLGYKSRSTINKIELGINDVKQSKIGAIAKALSTTTAYLLGLEEFSFSQMESLGLLPVERRKIPMLGEIACGEPKYCEEEFQTFYEASGGVNADFCLIAKGDSMINARIHDGDVVFIKQQPSVENGEIAAVVIEDEATLKRVYYYPDKNKLVLSAENPAYEPFVYTDGELDQIQIIGKAVAFQSLVK